MSDPNDSAIPRKEDVDRLQWMREEERHEIGWVGHRMGWMLVAQSFLMTAAIVSQSRDYPWWGGTAVTFRVGCLGVWLALRGGLAIQAAQIVTHAWLRREQYLCKDKTKGLQIHRLNRPIHLGRPLDEDHLHTVAVKLHKGMHKPFVAAWIVLFISGWAVAVDRLNATGRTDPDFFAGLLGGCATTTFSVAAFSAFAAAVVSFYFVTYTDRSNLERAERDLEKLDQAEYEAERPTSPNP